MTPYLSNYFLLVAVFLFLYILFLCPAFKNITYVFRFIQKKIILAVLVGFYFSFGIELTENDSYTFIAILSILLYVFLTLAKDCPNGHAENAAPLLKAAFTFITFFTSFSFERTNLSSTIVTLILLFSLCVISFVIVQKTNFGSKSEKLELILLCIEHLLTLIISALLASDRLMIVVIMALTEEIILVLIHMVVMYIVKYMCSENTIGYFSKKREELLF